MKITKLKYGIGFRYVYGYKLYDKEVLHRIGMPTIKYWDEVISWRFNGLAHRLNGLSSTISNVNNIYELKIKINTNMLVI